MKHKKSYVTVFRRTWNNVLDWEQRENWFVERTEGFSYVSYLKGEEAAEEAFHLTNAPEDCLTDEQKDILIKEDFKGPSLSVGDVVKVANIPNAKLPEYYICKSFGWEKFNGNVIELLRYLV